MGFWGALAAGAAAGGASALLSGGGKSSSVKAAPLTTPEQRRLQRALIEWISNKRVGLGAEAYPGVLPGMGEVPELFTQAYEDFVAQYGRADVAAAISDLISGEPAYTFDPIATAKTWEETYSTPVMETWKSTVLPMLEEQYNIPGGFYSTRKGLGVGRAAGEFYGGYVAPTLFGALQTGEKLGAASLEAAAARRPGALTLPGQQFAQAAQVAMAKMGLDEKQLTALFNEFLRTRAEPGWGSTFAAQLAGIPVQQPVGFQGYDPTGDYLAMGLAGTQMYLNYQQQQQQQQQPYTMQELENPYAYE